MIAIYNDLYHKYCSMHVYTPFLHLWIYTPTHIRHIRHLIQRIRHAYCTYTSTPLGIYAIPIACIRHLHRTYTPALLGVYVNHMNVYAPPPVGVYANPFGCIRHLNWMHAPLPLDVCANPIGCIRHSRWMYVPSPLDLFNECEMTLRSSTNIVYKGIV